MIRGGGGNQVSAAPLSLTVGVVRVSGEISI